MSDDEWYDNNSSEQLDDEYEELEVAGESCHSREDDAPVYKIINKTSLLAAQHHDLRRVADVLGIRLQHARTLLIYHRWDVEALFGKLADQGEERLFLSAGLPAREHANLGLPQKLPPSLTCRICYVDVSSSDATMMDCGHSFCNDCWTQYFIIKIKDGQSRRVTCMEEKCNAICDEDKVRKLVGAVEQDACQRYDLSLLESYIEDNSKVKWCPSVPHCGNAISVEGEPYCELECVCTQQFCFNCLEEPHSPCSCQMWKLWDKKCKDESETVNWLTAHTKPCPKCHKLVEKNGGCNLVGCICGQAFCWLCGAATGREHTWSSIQGHSCGRYKEDIEKEAERAQRDLKRYIHYHSRWKAHMDSLQLEQKKKEEAHARIAKMEASESQVKDYTWLTNGLQRLFRARRSLSYSYAFAYYMFGNDLFKGDIEESTNEMNQYLFEDQQQQLEGAVEKLSKLVETNMELNTDDDNVQKMRMEVINLTALTDTLCRRMYDVIENDLLGSLELTSHHIAPYRSQGYTRVAEMSDCGPLLHPPDAATAGVNADSDSDQHQQACAQCVPGPGPGPSPRQMGIPKETSQHNAVDEAAHGPHSEHVQGTVQATEKDSNGSGHRRVNLKRPLHHLPPEGSVLESRKMQRESGEVSGSIGGGNESNGRSHGALEAEERAGGDEGNNEDAGMDSGVGVRGPMEHPQRATDGGGARGLEDVGDEAIHGVGVRDRRDNGDGEGRGDGRDVNPVCPVCQVAFDYEASNEHINDHIDQCLANTV